MLLRHIVPLAATGLHSGISPWGLILLAAIAGLSYWFVHRRRKRQVQRERQERERQQRDRDRDDL